MANQFLTAFLFTTAYAVIRYAGFGHVSLIHVPVYIMNKSISMTAVEALFMAALGLMRSEKDAVRFWTDACSQLVFVHILLSLGILTKGYFASYFEGDKMSLTGEVVLLMGALAAYCFWRLKAAAIKPALQRTLTLLACTLVAVHLFAMGFDGWLHVEKWNGGMPPITLLSFLLVISSLTVYLRAKERHVSPTSEEGRVLPSEVDA
ncbi:MAG TPA: hypothetical protein VL197_02015 [Nitrospirota bacterium]|nr:hypothetical protein [Nitrospirota bacterium]